MSRASVPELYAVIKIAGGAYVTDVAHRETTDWATGGSKVEFRVTSANLSPGEMDRMRYEISEALERVRPAGIQFVVAVVPVDSPVNKYPPPPQSTSPRAEPVPLASRNRFAAVVEELTESPPGELSVPIGNLGRELVDLAPNGRLRCRRCSTEAFEPNVVQLPDGSMDVKVICRGCPEPLLVSIDHIPDGLDVLDTNPYRCWSCNRRSEITMTISEMNVYCPACNKLAIHKIGRPSKTEWKAALANAERLAGKSFDVEWNEDELKPVSGVEAVIDATTRRVASALAMDTETLNATWEVIDVDSGQVVGTYRTYGDAEMRMRQVAAGRTDARYVINTVPKVAEPTKTKVISGAKATLTMTTRDGKKLTMKNVDFSAVEDDVVKVGQGRYVPGKPTSFSLQMTVVDKSSDKAKEILSALATDPLADAIELMRKQLKLEPFTLFASKQYRTNRENRLVEYDWLRRTGRTTFGLINALAKCAVDNIPYLLVDASTPRVIDFCCRQAVEMRNRCTNVMPMNVLPVSDDRDYAKQMGRNVTTYVDHTAVER